LESSRAAQKRTAEKNLEEDSGERSTRGRAILERSEGLGLEIEFGGVVLWEPYAPDRSYRT
jgi:hypothetical protein